MYSVSAIFAFGLPRTSPFWGIPLTRPRLPVAIVVGLAEFLPPPSVRLSVIATAVTIAAAASRPTTRGVLGRRGVPGTSTLVVLCFGGMGGVCLRRPCVVET